MRFFLCSLLVLSQLFLFAQEDDRLIAKYSFDDCIPVNDLNADDFASVSGNPECDCGATGNSFLFENLRENMAFTGQVLSEFNSDFTLSFYMKPTDLVGSQPQEVLSKREGCGLQNTLLIDYTPFNRRLTAVLSERQDKQAVVTTTLDDFNCWHYVTIVRQNTEFFLYVNGTLRGNDRTSTRANIENSAPLYIANTSCNATHVRYRGYIDELSIYNRPLNGQDILASYNPPDKIVTPNALIVLGDSVDVAIGETCASTFNWTPFDGVFDTQSGNTTIRPPLSGTLNYELAFDDGNCIARDSIIIRVVNPDELNCDEVFLPDAFTPNGDNLNETFGISNPFVVERLKSFEIYDRWGKRLFFTENKEDQWDGTFAGEILNPGRYFYRVVYFCQESELTKTNAVTLIR